MEKSSDLCRRNYNIDIIRIFAMFLVALLHLSGMGGMEEGSTSLATLLTARVLNAVSMCCINLFSLTTGYLLCNRTMKIKRLLGLWAQVFFFSVACFVVGFLISGDRSLLSLPSLGYLMPICFAKYWYISVYFAVYLFSPFFNMLIGAMNKRKYTELLITVFICFSIIVTVFGEDTFLVGCPSFVWITTMYFTGAYIKKYGLNIKMKVLAILSVLSLALTVAFEFIPKQFRSYGEKNFSLNGYNSFTIIIMSVTLFVMLLNMKLNVNEKIGKIIKAFSVSSLAVYLTHAHEVIFYKWIVGQFKWIGAMSAPIAALTVIGISLAITVAGCIAGMIQQGIFKLLRIDKLCECIGNKLTDIKHRIGDRITVSEL